MLFHLGSYASDMCILAGLMMPPRAETDSGVRVREGVTRRLEEFSPCLVSYHTYRTRFAKKESHMYGVLNEVYLQKFFMDGCNVSR